MARSPSIERLFPSQEFTCRQVFEADTGNLYEDDPDSLVLVLGDSFLRIYQTDNPKAVGLSGASRQEPETSGRFDRQ